MEYNSIILVDRVMDLKLIIESLSKRHQVIHKSVIS